MIDQNINDASRSLRLMRLPEVQRMTGMGRSTIWKRSREGTFPAPIKQGPRTTAWVEGQVVGWIAALVAEQA